MSNLKKYERIHNIKKTLTSLEYKIFNVIFFPTRFAYKLYKPSKLRKWIKTRKYRKQVIGRLYKDLLYDGELILTDCWVSEDDGCGIISTESYNSYYPFSRYKYHSGKNSSQLLIEILSIFKQDENVIVEEIEPEKVFKWGYGRYKDKTFYKIIIK